MWSVLLTGMALLGWLTLSYSWNVFDEGFTAKGGELVLRGKVLYRDFLTLYGPAQFYILAALYWMFGVQLVVLRLWSIVVLGLFGLVAYLVTARISGDSRRYGMAAMAASFLIFLYRVPLPGYSMIPAEAFLVAAALPLHRFAVSGQRSALGFASLLIGVAALFRWDQGVFGLASLFGALVIWLIRSKLLKAPIVLSLGVWALVPAIALIGIVYGSLIFAAGPRFFVEDVLTHSIRDFEAYRGIAFMRPQVWDILHAVNRGAVLEVVALTIPLGVACLTTLVAACTLGYGLRGMHGSRSATSPASTAALTSAVFLALVVLGLMNQMRIRPDVSRAILIGSAATPLFAYWWHFFQVRQRSGRWRFACTAALTLAASWLLIGAYSAVTDTVKSRELVVTESPYSRYIRNPVHEPKYNALINYVRSNTKPGEVIYSGVTDHQVLFINDAMIYFLSGRDGPTRFYEMDPGLANTAEAQEHTVHELERLKVRFLVLWDRKSIEPNRSSKPNGVEIVDRYIRQNFEPHASFGAYHVWVRRASNGE